MYLKHTKLHVPVAYLDIFFPSSFSKFSTFFVDRNSLVGNVDLHKVFFAGVLSESNIGNLNNFIILSKLWFHTAFVYTQFAKSSSLPGC